MIRSKIIEIISEILNDFFAKTSSSQVHSKRLRSIILLGVHTLIRVFEYSLFQTKSLENSYIYVKKGESYFLEYLEQITNSEYMETMNLSDMELFIYKKTIVNINHNNDETMLNNMMTLSDSSMSFEDSELTNVFKEIRKCVKILFYWDNNNISITHIKELNQKYFAILLDFSNNQEICFVLQHIQQHIDYSYVDYKVLIKEIIDINKKKKMKTITNEELIQRFYCDKEILIENNKKLSIKQFVKWLVV